MTPPRTTAAGVEADLAALLGIPSDFSSQPATQLPQRKSWRAGDRTMFVSAGTLMALTITLGLVARQSIDKPVPASPIPKATATLVGAMSHATAPSRRTPTPAEVALREAPAGPVTSVRTGAVRERGADATSIGNGEKDQEVVAFQFAPALLAPPTAAPVSPPATELIIQEEASAIPTPVVAAAAARERWTGIDAIRALRQR